MTKVIRASVATTPDTTKPLQAGAPTTNEAGGVAYTSSDREATLSYLMTGGFGSTFYVDEKTHDQRARDLFARAAKTDATYLAKAAVYARQNGYMRSMPILALAFLSTAEDKPLFQRAFMRIILTPGDLADFVALLRGESRVRGSSRTVRRAIATWLSTITPYHVIKYGSESQKMSLRDIYRLAHPKLATAESQAIATYVVKGAPNNELPEALPSQLKGYHTFKTATDTIPNLLAMVAEHRLPWEVVSGQLGGGDSAEKTLVWTEMSKQMPYMALLRNLNNFAKYGVLDNVTERQRILSTLSDPQRVASSKQFPFRFISALRAYEGAEMNPHKAQVEAALRAALNASVGNMPNLGRSLIMLDVSGSMSTAAIGQGHRATFSWGVPRPTGIITAADIGSIFAAAVYKGSENPTLMTFDTSVRDETSALHRDMGVYEIAQVINRQGGGTSLSEPLRVALTRPERYDTMVFITDSESWADTVEGYNGYTHATRMTATQELLTKYRSQLNPNLKVFFLQLIPTTTRQTQQDAPNTFYTFGWSEDVLRYMSYQATSAQNDAVLATEV